MVTLLRTHRRRCAVSVEELRRTTVPVVDELQPHRRPGQRRARAGRRAARHGRVGHRHRRLRLPPRLPGVLATRSSRPWPLATGTARAATPAPAPARSADAVFKRLFWLVIGAGFGFGVSFWLHAVRAGDRRALPAGAGLGRPRRAPSAARRATCGPPSPRAATAMREREAELRGTDGRPTGSGAPRSVEAPVGSTGP